MRSQDIRSPPENLPEVALIAATPSLAVITNMPIFEASAHESPSASKPRSVLTAVNTASRRVPR